MTVSRGAFVDASIGTSPAGDAIMGEVGIESAGIRAFPGRRWIMQWDVAVALKGGVLGNTHPYLGLFGPHMLAWTEVGVRFRPNRSWSPYLGAQIAGEAQVLSHPGTALAVSELQSLNPVDGTGGATAHGGFRIAAGTSYLDETRSLLVDVFVEEALGAPQANTLASTFTEIGIAARFDVWRSLEFSVEGIFGLAPTRDDALRGTTDQTTRVGGAATFRKIFANRMWFGASVFVERDSDHVVYTASNATYDTANAPSLGVTLLFGIPLTRNKR